MLRQTVITNDRCIKLTYIFRPREYLITVPWRIALSWEVNFIPPSPHLRAALNNNWKTEEGISSHRVMSSAGVLHSVGI